MSIINTYKRRWLVEEFFKTLKYVCKVEDAQLETGIGLKKFIILKSITSYILSYLLDLGRNKPYISCEMIFVKEEWKLLARMSPFYKRCPRKIPCIGDIITAISMLGGYLNRNNDPPPGMLVLSRGWVKFLDALSIKDMLVYG